MAKVFIGMPAYNSSRFIREAVDSLRNQSFRDWTMLISDDASRDNTQTICEAFAAKDSRITYYRQQKNIGMFPNFRFLFDRRDPDAGYYMQAAHDDFWEPGFIETCGRALEEKKVGVAFTGMAMIDEHGRVTRSFPNLSALSGPASARTAYRFVRQPEIQGKANSMYGVYTVPAVKAAWEYAPHSMQWAHDALFSLAAISRYGLAVSPDVLFKKRTGGFSDPGSNLALPADSAYNFIPIGGHRFTHHIKSLRRALTGTGYANLATLIMFSRGIRPALRHLRTRNYKKKLHRIINLLPL